MLVNNYPEFQDGDSRAFDQGHCETLWGALMARVPCFDPLLPQWEGNGNPLQYLCLEKPMDRGAWWATVPGFAKNWLPLSDSHFHFLLRPPQGPGRVGQRLLCTEQSAGLGLSWWERGQVANETPGPLSPHLLSLTLAKHMVAQGPPAGTWWRKSGRKSASEKRARPPPWRVLRLQVSPTPTPGSPEPLT